MRKNLVLCLLLFSIGCLSQNKLEVFFDFNKDVPNEASQIKINQWVLDNKTAEITKVLGYCDTVDDSKYNKDLAMRRINSVVDYLNKSNIKIAEKAELKSFGKDFKHSKNQSEDRKVEVFYSIPKTQPKAVKDYEFTPTAAEVEQERASLVANFRKAKKGDIIRINNIGFYLNSEKMMEASEPILEELLFILEDNPKLRIEIHGHICCNPNPMDTKLSFRRAIGVFKYLADNGIPIYRLAYKGFGSNDPIFRIPERTEEERRANRRVEILIVEK